MEIGYVVTTAVLDVSDATSVQELAKLAAEKGFIHAVSHTVRLSPSMPNPESIVNVNLIGTARIIETFEKYLSNGTVDIMVSSMSGYMTDPVDAETEKQLAKLRADELKAIVSSLEIKDSGVAYSLSEKANQLQVQYAATRWGKKGVRIVSISPGIISTPMVQAEKNSNSSLNYMISNSPVSRIGASEDIAGLVDFLQSPTASFLNGIDILIDGVERILPTGRKPA